MKAKLSETGMNIEFEGADQTFLLVEGSEKTTFLTGKNAKAAIAALRTVLDGCKRTILNGGFSIRIINNVGTSLIDKLMVYLRSHQIISETNLAAFLVA
jgi:hypothetical protein